jgi:hypothetical protein
MRQPRKAPAKYLEGAPPYLLAIYDQGEKVGDRYTALFGWPLWDEKHPHTIHYLGFNAVPTSPNMGISMWGELKARSDRTGLGKLIAWADMPEDLQRHIISRANEGEPIVMKRLVRMTGPDGVKQVWAFENEDGVGYWGPTYDKKAEACTYAKDNLIVLLAAST